MQLFEKYKIIIHIIACTKYIESMRKLIVFAACACTAACLFTGCKKSVNYLDYISEKRTDIYLYSNDGLEIKIYNSDKETPYCADGIKGNMGGLCEIFVTLPENKETVEISAGNINGEMSFRAVDNCYYLSAADGGIKGESAQITLTYGDKSETYTAQSVRYDGVMSCESAVKCVIDHNAELFKSLTENKIFKGEIFVRLLYDEGCYYFVGVCDRNSKITAYLVDGERGKIIAQREING